LGPDPRRALWPAASPPHKQAGHMTAPDQCCSKSAVSVQCPVCPKADMAERRATPHSVPQQPSRPGAACAHASSKQLRQHHVDHGREIGARFHTRLWVAPADALRTVFLLQAPRRKLHTGHKKAPPVTTAQIWLTHS